MKPSSHASASTLVSVAGPVGVVGAAAGGVCATGVSGAGACVKAGTPIAMPSNPAASTVSERFHIALFPSVLRMPRPCHCAGLRLRLGYILNELVTPD